MTNSQTYEAEQTLPRESRFHFTGQRLTRDQYQKQEAGS